jgi:hypothetical protein
MNKLIYVFITLVFIGFLLYLAKDILFYNVKEGASMLTLTQQSQNLAAAQAGSSVISPGQSSGYAASTPTPAPTSGSAASNNPNNYGKDANGKDILGYDTNGNPIIGYNADGTPILGTIFGNDNYYQNRRNSDSYVPDAANYKYKDITSNLDTVFHDDYASALDDYGNPSGTSYVVDKDGKLTAIPPIGLGNSPIYFQPQDYVNGSLTYVPNYEDSVYLSRTANLFIGEPVVQTSSIQGGICNYYKNNPDQLEQACQKTDPAVCASTSCCVLLGGAKCVSGSRNGPTMKSHYSNTMIPNRDYYYYQSKCYGNCPRN